MFKTCLKRILSYCHKGYTFSGMILSVQSLARGERAPSRFADIYQRPRARGFGSIRNEASSWRSLSSKTWNHTFQAHVFYTININKICPGDDLNLKNWFSGSRCHCLGDLCMKGMASTFSESCRSHPIRYICRRLNHNKANDMPLYLLNNECTKRHLEKKYPPRIY